MSQQDYRAILAPGCNCGTCEHARNMARAEIAAEADKKRAEMRISAGLGGAVKDATQGPMPPPMTALERARIRAEVLHLVAQAFASNMDRIDLVDMITEEWWSTFGRTGADARVGGLL